MAAPKDFLCPLLAELDPEMAGVADLQLLPQEIGAILAMLGTAVGGDAA